MAAITDNISETLDQAIAEANDAIDDAQAGLAPEPPFPWKWTGLCVGCGLLGYFIGKARG